MPTAPTLSALILFGLALPQTKPVGGAIDKYVPAVPTPASFISDQRRVLSAEAHQSLDARIAAIQRAGLGDIAVAIVPDISSYSPNQLSVEIYRVWRVGSVAAIGSAHKDVGALLLIVPKELAPNRKGQCWIAVGTGAEGIITDATAGTICRDVIIPRLRTRDYAGAIGVGIDAIAARLRGDAGLTAPGSDAQIAAPRPVSRGRGPSGAQIWIVVGGLLALIGGLFGGRRWRRYRPRTCPRCGKRMRRLDEAADDAKLERGERDEEKLGSIDYDVWVCDCGQTLKVPYPKWFSRYSKCRSCGRKTASHVTVTLIPATTISTGMAEKQYDCHSCGEKWHETVVLPRIVQSSSGGGSSGGGGGGGGGGSSFGGSGSTSGGGGGGSY